jgi:transcriptional regulator with XRE-family HTH domain
MTKRRRADERDKERGAALRLLRKIRGVNQEHIAKHLGISAQQYGKYERGEDQMTVNLYEDIRELLRAPDSPGFAEEGQVPYVSPGVIDEVLRHLDEVSTSIKEIRASVTRLAT